MNVGIVGFLDFNEANLEIVTSMDNFIYNKSLGIWTVKNFKTNTNTATTPSEAESAVPLISDRMDRIDKLKTQILQNSSNEVGQHVLISELEFELSLIFVNLRNGKLLKAGEEAHFHRTLAIYALKLAKDNGPLKAKELIEDLRELGCEELVNDLLTPLFTSNSISSTWQDLISHLN